MNDAIFDWWTIPSAGAEEFIRWQDQEYLPDLQNYTGVIRAHRYSVNDSNVVLDWIDIQDGGLAGDDHESSNRVSLPPRPVWKSDGSAPQRLTMRLHRDIAASTLSAPWIYVVQADIPDEVAAEYNDWYDREHLPRLVEVEGIVRARRYVAVSGSPHYLTAYDLTTHDAFQTPAALKARKTPWTEKMRGLFQNSRRSMLRLEAPSYPRRDAR